MDGNLNWFTYGVYFVMESLFAITPEMNLCAVMCYTVHRAMVSSTTCEYLCVYLIYMYISVRFGMYLFMVHNRWY